jgi:PqqD family protein of HPr-rel-A system
MPAERRYRAAPAAALHCVELDALTAVFDRRSGQTHLLAAPLPELLEALGSGDWTLSDFARHLADQFDLTSNTSAPAQAGALADSAALDTQSSGLRRSTDGVERTIANRIHELVALGLVEIA